MTDEKLDAIENWCARILQSYEDGEMLGELLCGYTDELPTHSIRSTVARLSTDLRATRSALRQLLAATDAVLDNEWFASGGTVTNAYIVAEDDWTTLREARVLVSDVSTQETK